MRSPSINKSSITPDCINHSKYDSYQRKGYDNTVYVLDYLIKRDVVQAQKDLISRNKTLLGGRARGTLIKHD